MTEHSDRARYVTEQVALWLANDASYRDQALYCIREGRHSSEPFGFLARHITAVLRGPLAEFSAPWQVAQELAPNDYRRIHWADVAAELGEDDEE